MKNKIVARMWHRVFGWGTVTTPPTEGGKVLFDSDHKHIKQYIMGKGWISYKGDHGENIKSIFVHIDELFDSEQSDDKQKLINKMVEVLS